jgi:hypothetical protein
MEGFSRDLLCGIGKGGDGPRGEVRPRVDMEAEEVELNLGLSLGGRFGLDRRGEKLARSSSVAAILAAPTEPSAPPSGLFRTSSLPTVAAAEAAKKQGVDELNCRRPSGGAEAEPAAARLPASGSPSSGSSDGEGRRLEGASSLLSMGACAIYLSLAFMISYLTDVNCDSLVIYAANYAN